LGATLGERSLVSLAGVWFERAVEAPRGLESVLMRQAASSVNLVLGAACGHTVGRGLCRPSRRLHLRMRPMRRLCLCRPYTLTMRRLHLRMRRCTCTTWTCRSRAGRCCRSRGALRQAMRCARPPSLSTPAVLCQFLTGWLAMLSLDACPGPHEIDGESLREVGIPDATDTCDAEAQCNIASCRHPVNLTCMRAARVVHILKGPGGGVQLEL